MTQVLLRARWFVVPAIAMIAVMVGQPASAPAGPISPAQEGAFVRSTLSYLQPTQSLPPLSATKCRHGYANIYPCKNVDLMSFLPMASIGGGQSNDVWGWIDPKTGRQYAIMGRSTGTSFVDITDPAHPTYLGNLPTQTISSPWRDIETYKHYLYVVADRSDNHGMQVFDLHQLRDVQNPPVTFQESAHYGEFGPSHTLTIDQATGFLYANGSNTCLGGLHMVDIRKPLKPKFAGCYSDDGYTHDVQCVVYHGPDAAYVGREICFASNVDTLTIVDVTDKAAPHLISRTPYAGSGFTHQGRLMDGDATFVLDDELDEADFGHGSWTRFFDVSDLDAPVVDHIYQSNNTAIDHNLFIKDGIIYESNYRSGLRIIAPPGKELGFFDVYPSDDLPQFSGTWCNYPYFKGGIVAVSSIGEGLFILRPKLP
jgi:choice-of-anchor B domain-containing protein